MTDYHVGLVEALIALIGGIFWFAKLEFNVAQSKKDIELIQEKHDDLSTEIREELKSISSSLARLEGKMSVEHKGK